MVCIVDTVSSISYCSYLSCWIWGQSVRHRIIETQEQHCIRNHPIITDAFWKASMCISPPWRMNEIEEATSVTFHPVQQVIIHSKTVLYHFATVFQGPIEASLCISPCEHWNFGWQYRMLSFLYSLSVLMTAFSLQ